VAVVVAVASAAFVCGGDQIAAQDARDWPQFRGPNAQGVAVDSGVLPIEIGPDRNLAWKVAVPRGHSSPVIVGGRIYLTALDGDRLVTMALDQSTGKVLWHAVAPYEQLERVHRTNSPATASVATDGEHVVSFFGSCGLFCYDSSGRLLWHQPMGPFDNEQGATSSPILVDDRVILLEDHDTGSFLAAFDKESGSEMWRVDRSAFRRGYMTPIIWETAEGRQIVVAGSAQVTAYDFASGKLLWRVRGVARVVSATPVVGDDGMLYVVNSGGSEAEFYPEFGDVVASSDANGNGLLEADELPEGTISRFISQFDLDGNAALDEAEYETIREIISYSRSVAMAIRPGGRGDVTGSHVLWDQTQMIPRNASPLYHQGYLYLVKDGGILTTLDARNGEIVKRGRVGGGGRYYSSPIVADGKIFLASDTGEISVLTAEPDWEELASAQFEEETLATPAVVGGRLYLRTAEHLYCFGMPPGGP